MTFRDDRLALAERADQQERALSSLERELAHAHGERDLLRARMAELGIEAGPARGGPRALHWLLDRAFVLVFLFVGATVAAGYKSERYGVAWSLGIAVSAGCWAGARALRGAHAVARVLVGITGAMCALAFWVLFFSWLWPAL